MSDIAILRSLFSEQYQKGIYKTVKSLEPGFYTPVLKYGNKMNIQMNCLGWHWNAKTYEYEKIRSDGDSKEVASIPDSLQLAAKKALLAADYMKEDEIKPYDICICNFYDEDKGRLGVHQDDSERKETLDAGYPIVSISIGADATFLIGPTKKDLKEIILHSGDVIIFGRKQRLAFHGVKNIIKGTTPEFLEFENPGRLNLTFRAY